MFGLWLLYAGVGLLVVIAASASADIGADSGDKSPTGWAAKIVGALSGLAFAAAALGLYLAGDPDANAQAALMLKVVGAGLGAIFTIWCWALIVRDLRR